MSANTETEKMQHTPGPWRATSTYGHDSREPWMVWSDTYDAAVCQVYRRSEFGDGVGIAEQTANARLIAAAPELLALCKSLLFHAENGRRFDMIGQCSLSFTKDEFENALRAVIAKATGC